MNEKQYYVYILTNGRRTVLYVGLTGDIRRRMEEHRAGIGSLFTRKYNVHILVHVESFSVIHDAAQREHQLKAGSRAKKVALIDANNPGWRDLSGDV